MMRTLVAYFSLLFLCISSSYALKYHAADISSLLVVESQGVSFSDNGKVAPFEDIMKAHGGNTVRIRVWTAGQYNTTYGLKLAKRVKAAGMTLIVDLHLSDTCSGRSGSSSNSFQLADDIVRYTMQIVQQFAAQGTPIDILQIGNEINNGILWPVGEISVNGINPVSQLLNSAVNGAKAAGFSGKTLLHLANGWDWSGLDSFFGGVFIPGALSASEIDLIGVSFYPFYDAGATLSALESSLTNLANTFKKPIVVAETDWPVSCPGVTLTEPSIPVSAAGQTTWIMDIKNILVGLPNGLGQGIFYWEPG
ncbi:hypothetical protein Clacol_003802 [Clathrus columnatus]|uniref:Arabinogalactan endo-beta-1,4-galactanase n=1 Tax=Clathrus columnatus TaxID=1419009 RepID=A0AAV5AA21_9AGAM|nr:hypothetical protein Clacol_003802 [Clathrus columnatus]